MVCFEDMIGPRFIDNDEVVERYRHTYELLWSRALDGGATAERLIGLASSVS